ncbi:hypothetical protein [Streptomyces sp. NPDC088258]|uniref:hypothetical protein n=1 Tax=Streptomyces sp. NPDC088258 TaxID=3365849 RepID=UPI0037F8B46A
METEDVLGTLRALRRVPGELAGTARMRANEEYEASSGIADDEASQEAEAADDRRLIRVALPGYDGSPPERLLRMATPIVRSANRRLVARQESPEELTACALRSRLRPGAEGRFRHARAPTASRAAGPG